jgi:hypothetical protein
MARALTVPVSSELIEIIPSDQGALLSFQRCLAENAVLRERRRELLRAVTRILNRSTQARRIPARDAVELTDISCLADVLPEIRLHVDSLARRPCPPQMVNALLGIRSAERIRWTKDGRLAVAGSVPVRGGSGAFSPVYQAAEIAALAANRRIIEDWRTHDRADQ